eukprot:GEZU01035834.1.p1 GENE.GEZU01035834.1~~GEZU01035834.1.p1  ORF type:complete len:139 (+),score=24.23 GEZU01035834.1:174-590(+)
MLLNGAKVEEVSEEEEEEEGRVSPHNSPSMMEGSSDDPDRVKDSFTSSVARIISKKQFTEQQKQLSEVVEEKLHKIEADIEESIKKKEKPNLRHILRFAILFLFVAYLVALFVSSIPLNMDRNNLLMQKHVILILLLF